MRLIFFAYFFLGIVSATFGQATLRVGDPLELKIAVVPAEEQTQIDNVYTVDAKGAINLPYIGRVSAGGITPSELARAIEEAYRANKIYTNPNITIVMQPTSRFVNVGGSVRNPTR